MSERSIPVPVEAVAAAEASRLMTEGALAVVLTGSYAAGNPMPYADIDLVAVGEGPHYALYQRDKRLVAVAWRTAERVEAEFASPPDVATVVPGWRQAVILDDPEGIAAQLQKAAREWDWGPVADATDRYVAEAVTGFAEEARKLAGAMDAGNETVAAVQRAIMALRLPGLMALHRRLLYGSENRLWELVAETEGEPWRSAQARALGTIGASPREANEGALNLFRLLAADVAVLASPDERMVLEGTLALLGSQDGG